jgi:hypothetical protein
MERPPATQVNCAAGIVRSVPDLITTSGRFPQCQVSLLQVALIASQWSLPLDRPTGRVPGEPGGAMRLSNCLKIDRKDYV